MSGVAEAPAIDPARVIADLRELDARTGGPGGARRLCWGEEWRAARELLGELLAEIDLEPERDEAGNLWTYLPGEREPALALGSHLDSVPEGGWLDGALGVMAGARRPPGLGNRRRPAASHPRAGRLGRRGRGPLRAQPFRQLGRVRHLRPRGAGGRRGR